MAEEQFQERTEQATPRRREKAREDGMVARSADLNAAAVLVLGFLSLLFLGPYMANQTAETMRHLLMNAPSIAAQDPTFRTLFTDNLIKFFGIVGPLMGILLIVGVGASVAQVGFHISPKAIAPKLEKLDVVKGMKRLFSMRSLVTLVRDTLKLIVVGFIAWKVIAAEVPQFFQLSDMSAGQLAIVLGKLSLSIALKIGAAVLIIAVLDYAWQKYDFEKSIRMSRQELKDEFKDTEGSPTVKMRVRQIQREMARKRMMAAVPTADVVITNPIHLAVAIKYDTDEHATPFVVAKGERLVAQRIKEIAKEHGIPVIEDVSLARALFKLCDIGQVIPETLYRAVAEILAYVYKLNGKLAGGR
jgi:flagellar biosynthetic protein FlhB